MPNPTCIPISENQYGLWLFQTLNPASSAYNTASAFRVLVPLDGAALQQALMRVVGRHPMLRTTFALEGERPVQHIHPELAPLFEELDGAGLTEADLQKQVQAAHDRPFDLSTGPLVRLTLFRRAAADQIVLFSSHHILLDFRAHAQITQEILAAYQCESGQNETAAPTVAQAPAEAAASYTEFVTWQQALLTSARSKRHQAYWREQLQAPLPQLTLPTDHPYPPQQTFNGGSQHFRLAADLTQRLFALAEQKAVTPFMLLLAAYTLLLARYSRQAELIVGIPTSERLRLPPRFQQTIGHLVNLLPMRFTLALDGPFTDLLQQTQKVVMQGLFHQNYPFAWMVRDAQIERDPSRAPLFEVSFNMPVLDVNATLVPLVIGKPEHNVAPSILNGLPLVPYPIEQLTAHLPLHLDVWQQDEQLVGCLKYNADLFEPATIAHMVEHFTVLLQAILADPNRPMRQLALLTQAEYHQIVYAWNATTVDFGPPQTIHARFEEQAARTPDAVAVVTAREQRAENREQRTENREQRAEHTSASLQSPVSSLPALTYRELNERANQLAHVLIELGVGRDGATNTLVGLYVERTLEMVIGVLAILKAGGAYVPLDPALPAERLHLILEDMADGIIVTQRHLLATLGTVDQQMICLDDEARYQTKPVHNPQTNVEANALAYILYTSGSTGKPKGVAVEHRHVFAYTLGVIQRCELEPGQRYAMVQPLTVDSSVTMLYPSLWTGGALYVVDRELSLDATALAGVFQAAAIDYLKIAPSHLAALLAASPEPQTLLPKKRLIIGGEVSQWRWVQHLLKHASCQIYNHYGPTETTVGVLTYRIWPDATAQRFHSTPIGYPLPNTQAYILDEQRQPVPIGCWGELYIGGELVTRGYLNRPDLTEERFIPNPFAAPSHPTANAHVGDMPNRLYKTGDWARYLPDGAVEFFGRMDDQVKIRGYRIELGEISSVLAAQDGVREVVVLAREGTTGDKQLVAYVVGDADPETLRRQLASHLPEYMIPAAIVMLPAMPLTQHGKLDRQALPAPDYTDPQHSFVAPSNQIEATLAAVFAQVLRLPQVDTETNFFRAGGDSILGIQLVSRIAQAGYRLRVQDLFQQPTVAELAAIIAATDATTHPYEPADQGLQLGDAPLLPIQQHFLAMKQPAMHHYNQSFLFQVKQALAPAALADAIRTLLCHHDALRFQYQPTADGWRQTYLDPSALAQLHSPLVVVDLQPLPPAERSAAIERISAEAQARLNPLTGDLVRFVYFKGETDPQWAQLLITIHHLAVDGVSWRILLEDLTTLLSGGKLPPKTSSYRAWGELLQVATQNGAFDGALSQWLTDGEAARLEPLLPMDAPTAPNTFAHSYQLTLTLSERQTAQLLRTLPARHDVTLDAVLLTALTETLTQWAGANALRVKFESYGRQELFAAASPWPTQSSPDRGHSRIDLNRTIGWFTSTYPLTIARSHGSAVARLRATQAQLRRITDGGISFGVLQTFHPDAQVRAQLAALPPAQIVYNYLGQLDSLETTHFVMAPESVGLAVAPTYQRATLLDSNALIHNRQLQIQWRVSPQLERTKAETLLSTFRQQLDGLIAEALRSTETLPLPVAATPTPPWDQAKKATTTASWFVTLRKEGARPPLFCFYPVTGTVSPFRNLIPYLGEQQPLYALQARGIYDDFPPFKTLEALAADTIIAIKQIQPIGPYHLLGWSFGAKLAYELAQQFQAQGDAVALLALLDEYPNEDQGFQAFTQTPDQQLARFIANLGLEGAVDPQALLALCQATLTEAADQPIPLLCQQLARAGYVLPFAPGMVERIYKVFLNNVATLADYKLQPYQGPMLVFSTAGGAAAAGMARWQKLAAQPVEQIFVPGSHLTMLNAEYVERLGRELYQRLQREEAMYAV